MIESISIFAFVVSPLAVVAIPTNSVYNILKVAIPEGLLILDGSLSLSSVPLLILVALIPVKFVPKPENEYDVVIPVTFKFELIEDDPLTFKFDVIDATPDTFKFEPIVAIPVISKFLPIFTSLVALISPSLAIPTPFSKEFILVVPPT
jgi:hypothetical protein